MPQPRKRKTEPEPEEPEAREEETSEDEEEFDEEAASGGPNGLNIDIGDDRVIIELPRDGNERPTLEAIGAMLESMT